MGIKKLFIASSLLCLSQVQAQETTTASGGNASGSNGNISFTVGQLVYTTTTGSTGSVAQGVQQPFEIQSVVGIENLNINLQLAVYPNPTTNWLQLEMKNYEFSNLSYQLLDLNGRVIFNEKITSEMSTISMEKLPSSIYLLKVIEANNELKTFKVHKK